MVLSLLRERCGKECLDLLFVQSLYPGVSIRHQFFKNDAHLASRGNRASGIPASVQGILPIMMLRLVRRRKDAGANVCPCTIVERLLLHASEKRHNVQCTNLPDTKVGPHSGNSQGEELTEDTLDTLRIQEWSTYKIIWERRNLLYPANSNIVDLLIITFLQKRVVDLACNAVLFTRIESYHEKRVTCAKNVTTNPLGSNEMIRMRVGEVALEVSVADHVR